MVESQAALAASIQGVLATSYPDLVAEATRAELSADADHLGRMAATDELFLARSGHPGMAVRVA